MSYYIGATGEYIFDDKIADITSNIAIANIINLDATPLTDILQDIITDAAGTALSELIAPITEVPSATGVGVVALTALGLLSYYKLDRTAVQDADSMVYSSVSSSILTPGLFEDRVRIRYDTEWFSNAIYYDGDVKKGEILTYRPEQGSNILNLDATNIKLGTINNARLPTNYGTQLGIGTSPATQLHIYNIDSPTIRLEAGANGLPSIEFQRGATNDVNVDFKIVNDTGRLKFLSQDEVDTYQTPASEIMRMTRTQLSIYENTEINGNILLQSVAEGTPTLEFRRGSVSDVNKDYRFISQSDIFKLQFQDTLTYYGDANNQLISINDTDTIIHKQTEFKANVLIGGDTRTIGYVGIGTTAAAPLHIYTAAANILRLQTAPVDGTNSIEFMRGNSTDPLTDYRILTDTGGKFKIQYANNLLAYGATDTDLIELSTTNTIIHKPTEFKGNVGIGTTPHATYKVDVSGTINATAFRGDGANITALNEANLILTTTKLYNNFNQTNFAIIDDKIDLPPNYSFNITDYDSQTLFNPSTERKYKGKITANYDDRNGVYKLITTNNRTDNVAVLNYKVGDKISIRNTAIVANDYLLESGGRYWNSLLLIKRATNRPLNWAVPDPYSVLLYEWMSSDGLDGRPEARVRTPTNRYFPFTTIMTFLIEAGFNYYLCKLYNSVEVVGSSIIVAASGYGDDTNDFNRAFGAGQTFKLQITGATFVDDYMPSDYIGADIGIASERRLGGVKKGRGVAIDETTGTLDATPVSVDLITSMNTSHFTNNTGTNKIDISSTYVAPSSTKLATARNIAGTAFDGTANINITYGNLSSIPATWGESQIPSLPISKITNLQSTLDAKAPTSHSHAIADITNLQTTLDAKAPTSHSHAIGDITNLQTTLDAKQATLTAGTNITITGTTISSTAAFTPTSANLISVFNATQFVNNVGTSKIDIDVNWKPTTCSIADAAMKLVSSRNIAGVGFDGQNSIAIPYFNLDFKPTAGTGVSITTGSSTSSPVISATPTSANMIGIFNTSQFTNNTGTSRIDILSTWKPSGAVLADTATALATSRNIAGVAFNGTADISIDYFSLNNRPIILQPTTTNLQLVSGFTLSLPSNLAVGTTAIATNVLQVGAGGRLRISNGATDYTLLGTIDTDGSTNTSIVISGNTRANNAGNIQYIATASGGSHIFYTSSPITTRMTISSAGVNINDNLAMAGRTGFGTSPHATYRVDVNGTLNATSVLVGGNPISGSRWSLTPSTTNIFYNSGNVGIATTSTANANVKLQVGAGGALRIANNVADYTLIGTDDTDSQYNTRIVLSGNNRANVYGRIDYFATTGDHVFSTTYNQTERMRIASNGNVGIGISPSYKLHIKCGYDNVATGLHLDASDNTQYTLTIWPFVVGGGQVGWRFRTISFDGGTNTPLEFRHNGDIRFQADRWHGSSDGGLRIYYATNGTTYFRSGNALGEQFAWRSSLDNTFAYFNNNVLYAYMYNLSDRRIKRDIEEINDETALNMLLLVQPTTYYYKDETRNKGNGKVYGFIAQQIKEVIPDAVSITKEIIPNIYKTCLVYNKREIYHNIPQDVAIDTEVHILDKEIGEKGKRYKIKEIYEDHFVIDEDIDGDDCFVFGYEVNDLHAIDKSYIFTLNVCATQELHRRMEAQDKRIKELELKVERLLNYISL